MARYFRAIFVGFIITALLFLSLLNALVKQPLEAGIVFVTAMVVYAVARWQEWVD